MTQLYTLADALAAQTAVDWQIENVIAVASVGLVYGAPASKKTYSLLDLAMCTAIGKPWLGMPVRQGAVLLVDEESGPRRLLRRMGMAARGHLADASLPVFATSLEGFNFWAHNPKNGAKQLEAEIRRTQAVLVIVDALADVMLGGDENAVKDTQRALNALRQVAEATGATILIVHHALKNGKGYRGSSAINGALDAAIEVESEQDKALVNFKITKARDAEPRSWQGEAHFTPTEFWLTETAAKAQAGYKYTKGDRAVLTCMLALKGCATQTQIATATGYSDATVRNRISELIREGIIKRTDAGGPGTPGTYEVDMLLLVDNPL